MTSTCGKSRRIISRDEKINVLIVSPSESEHAVLRSVLTSGRWVLSRAANTQSARRQLRTAADPFSVILCECDQAPSAWHEILDFIADLPNAPLLIVASCFADERLWADALNLGAYDVLAKPFEAEEVIRVFTSAWMRWSHAANLKADCETHETTAVGA